MKVIIVANARSGSSFTAELFNNNPRFAYFFEPLFDTIDVALPHPDDIQVHPFQTEDVNRLRAIMQCNFSKTNYTWVNGRDINAFCARSNTFQRTDICKHDNEQKKTQSEINTLIEKSCRLNEHVAIKTVRVRDIGLLKSLVADPELNVKLIHLVRDPRAVELSRSRLKKFPKDRQHCEDLTNNLRYWQKPPDWLKSRHMLLRYEDLANDPLLITQQIYHFIGSEVPEEVKLWLQMNTNQPRHRGFWRSRVSRTIAQAWRETIDYPLCTDIQRMCNFPLKLLGYRSVSSIDDLRNLKVPILTKFDYPLKPNVTVAV